MEKPVYTQCGHGERRDGGYNERSRADQSLQGRTLALIDPFQGSVQMWIGFVHSLPRTLLLPDHSRPAREP